jgi:unsaturated rhamnogalacturonyl hydrolase
VTAAQEPIPAGQPWSMRAALSSMARNPDSLLIDSGGVPRWNYTQGLQLMAILKVWERTKDAKLFDYAKHYYDGIIDPDGQIKTYNPAEFNIDRINSGKCLFTLYRETKDEKYRKAIELLRGQMRQHPRTSEGGFWHKQIYPHQMWLDGLYMGSPFLAEYAATFGEPATLDDVALQFILMEKHARDEKTGLLYHAWDESHQQRWCDPATGRSRFFWGRAEGWYAMALVDALDFFPKDHPKRAELIAILSRLAEAIVKVQDPFDGVWYQILDQPTREKNYQEASVTTMFAYALLKGVRQGYLDPKYRAAGRKAYDGAVTRFVEVDAQGQVHIRSICIVAGLGGTPYRDGSYEYYVGERVGSDDPKGVGPFILASLENEAQQ